MEARSLRIWSATLAGLLALSIVGVASPAQADQIRDRQWHLGFLKADRVHQISKGRGATVAVVDTGVNPKHPDLSGNVLKGADFASTLGGDGWTDKDGHGTGMASLIAAHGHGGGGRAGVLGLAPEAKVLPVRSLVKDDSAGAADEAIRWAVDHGATVINFSGRASRLDGAVKYALSHDAVVVAAAGNTADGFGVGEPASLPGVVAVSGVDQRGDFTDASTEGPEVALAAPAVDVVSASVGESGYRVGTGTSGATALVSAAAALVRSKYPDLDAANVIERLIRTAEDKGETGRDNKYGFGVLNPLKALTADVPLVKQNPLGGPAAGGSGESTPAPSFAAPKDDGSGLGVGGAVLLVTGGAVAVVLLCLGAWLLLRRRRAGVPAPSRSFGGPPLSGRPPGGPAPPGAPFPGHIGAPPPLWPTGPRRGQPPDSDSDSYRSR